jgi:hypothetical protein
VKCQKSWDIFKRNGRLLPAHILHVTAGHNVDPPRPAIGKLDSMTKGYGKSAGQKKTSFLVHCIAFVGVVSKD